MDRTNIQKRMSLIVGASLILMAAIAGFGYGYGFESLYVANDTTATLNNLNASVGLFKLVVLSFILIMILDVIVAWALYVLFKGVSQSLSLICGCLRLIYSGILGVAIFHLFTALNLLDASAQNGNAILHSLTLFLESWSLGLIVFGGHLFLLGVILNRARTVPKLLGILALFAGVCYMLTNIAGLLFPWYEHYRATVDMALALPMALGELALAVWLLVKARKHKVI